MTQPFCQDWHLGLRGGCTKILPDKDPSAEETINDSVWRLRRLVIISASLPLIWSTFGSFSFFGNSAARLPHMQKFPKNKMKLYVPLCKPTKTWNESWSTALQTKPRGRRGLGESRCYISYIVSASYHRCQLQLGLWLPYKCSAAGFGICLVPLSSHWAVSVRKGLRLDITFHRVYSWLYDGM